MSKRQVVVQASRAEVWKNKLKDFEQSCMRMQGLIRVGNDLGEAADAKNKKERRKTQSSKDG